MDANEFGKHLNKVNTRLGEQFIPNIDLAIFSSKSADVLFRCVHACMKKNLRLTFLTGVASN